MRARRSLLREYCHLRAASRTSLHRSGFPAVPSRAASQPGYRDGVTTDPLAPLLDLADVAPARAAARDAVDAAMGHRALRERGGQVAAEVSLRAAVASAALEGSIHDRETVRGGTVTDPVVQGALRVAGGLDPLADLWPRAPRQVLAKLHLLAARGVVPDDQLGRLVGGPEVAQRLDALAALVAGNDRTPPLLLAAVVHAELLSLRPFAGPSGVVARAAARLTLIDRGLDPKSLVALEVGHLELAEQEQAALAEYRGGEPAGVVGWIEHCGRAIELGARESLAICEAIQRG